MIRPVAAFVVLLGGAALGCVVVLGGDSATSTAEFESPVMLKGGENTVRVESPGYAAPCWADVDKDGKKDLLVGQFSEGKIQVFKNLGDGKLAEGKWLEAGGEVATIPGVW